MHPLTFFVKSLPPNVGCETRGPVNVQGANPGDYIIAASSSGDIIGSVIADPTFAQYKKAVGRINKSYRMAAQKLLLLFTKANPGT